MTSTSTIGMPAQQRDARTVRDVALHSPELVNEVWCRKIFRQVLQALELQHATGVPHGAVSPDTIVLAPNGDPVLLPGLGKGAEPGECADVQALGAVVHFAITREMPPAGPLQGRGLAGYSDSLLGAVDKCIAPDRSERPRSIAELRNLLGIVSLGPPVPATPSFMHTASAETAQPGWPGSGLAGGWRRWLLVGLAALVLLAAFSALVTVLRGAYVGPDIVLSLPESAPASRSLDAGETLVAPPAAPGAPAQPAALPAATQAATANAPAPLVTLPAQAPAARSAAASTTYKLMIHPWGTVYVNGVERGVSPPLKRLMLPAGTHTIRIANPAFADHEIRVEAGRGQSGTIHHEFAEPSS